MVDISCIFPPAHLPFTLFPRSYLTFPKRSVFHELGVCSAWSLVALASGAWERQEGKRIQSHSFSLCPLSYLGRAWVDLGCMKKQEIRQENHVTLQGANGEGRALDRAPGEEEAHNHRVCYRVPVSSLSVCQVAHWGHTGWEIGEIRCRIKVTELRCMVPDICCNKSNERLKRKSLQRKWHKERGGCLQEDRHLQWQAGGWVLVSSLFSIPPEAGQKEMSWNCSRRFRLGRREATFLRSRLGENGAQDERAVDAIPGDA